MMSLFVKAIIRILAVVLLISFIVLAMTSCSASAPEKVRLKVYNADSLIIPFQEIEKQFEDKYPQIDVYVEGHGSIQVIRGVTELKEDLDVAAVADSQLICLLMYDTPMPDKNGTYADWCIEFAANSLGIAYTNKSRYAEEINASNWYEILSRPDVKIGLSDPRIDSLGYRALMALYLAGDYYHDPALMDKMVGAGFDHGIQVAAAGNLATISVPEVLKPSQDRIVLRTYSLQILALLESGDVDYSFEYESVIRQHKLNYLQLPAAIDLSSEEYRDTYRQVQVKMDFQRFATVNPVFHGAPIVYGITIPKSALHPREAEMFLDFLLDSEGQSILKRNFQPPLVPAVCDNKQKVPDNLRRLLK